MINYKKNQKGSNLVEVILALAIMLIFMSGAVTLVARYLNTTQRSEDLTQIEYVAQESMEALTAISYDDFSQLVDGTYGLQIFNDQWALAAQPDVVHNKYTRTVTISSVNRDINCNSSVCVDDDHDGYSTTNLASAIEVESNGNIIAPAGEMQVDVMASEITFGWGSSQVDVDVKLIKDGNFTTLFGGNDVDGGESYSETLTAETNIAIQGHAQYWWFINSTRRSDTSSEYVYVLQNGDPLPDVPVYGDQEELSIIIGPFLDENNDVDIDVNQVLILFDLVGTLGEDSADFQDLVILMSFDPDGYVDCGGFDCDDTDYKINPGATELCNGIDDDCNFLADEDFPDVFPNCDQGCVDSDGDGYNQSAAGCGWADCDDSDYYINLEENEICNNGIDDDCDTLIDGADDECEDVILDSDRKLINLELSWENFGSTQSRTFSQYLTNWQDPVLCSD